MNTYEVNYSSWVRIVKEEVSENFDDFAIKKHFLNVYGLRELPQSWMRKNNHLYLKHEIIDQKKSLMFILKWG